MTEKEFEYTVTNELNAIEYFIEVLNEPLLKDWSLNSLQGTIGKASAEVALFLKKNYKGGKFSSFFQHQIEFIVDGPFVKLSPSYRETFSKRRSALSVSDSQNSKWDLMMLYESNYFKEISNEFCKLFLEVCFFLENKNKTKLSRLEGIVTCFPKCLEWIKACDGATLAKQIGSFLCRFLVFEIFDEDYIYFSQKKSFDTILYFCDRFIQNKKIDYRLLFSQLVGPCNETFELSKDSYYLLKKILKNNVPIRYNEVVKILPMPLLIEIYEIDNGSKIIIDTMLKTGEFFFQNGKIFSEDAKNMSICIENGTNNSSISNEKIETKIESFGKNENNSKLSTGLNMTSQQTEEIHSIHCNSCNNTYLIDSVLMNSNTPNEFFLSSIPVDIFSDRNNSNNSPLQSSNSELAKCNSQTLDLKEEIKIESMNDVQIASLNNDSISSKEKCTHKNSNECNDPVDVLDDQQNHSDLNNSNNSPLQLSNSELAESNSQTLDLKEEIKIESMDDVQIVSINNDSNEIDSIGSKEKCIHMNSSECNDPIDVNGSVFQNSLESNSDEDYDSSVSEIDSPANLVETDPFSSLDEDKLTYTNDENTNTSNANENFEEVGFVEDLCVSSKFLNNYQENSILSNVKEINSSTPTIKQYIDLLNEDELPHENIDANENSISNEEISNHPQIGSQALHTNNNLNLYENETEVNCKQNLSSILNCPRGENEIYTFISERTDCKIAEHKSENITEIKHKAELLAKEVFQNGFHNIQQSKIFVACSNVIFLFKKSHLLKTYGPLICTKKDISKNLSETQHINNESSIDSNISIALNNSKLTENASLNHNYNSDIPAEVTMKDLYPPKKNSSPSNMSLHDSKNDLKEDPLHQESDSINELPEEVDSTNCSNSNINLGSKDCNLDLIDYPLQPILAEVVLLTADSCIAVAKIKSRKQNIYFLKCVFVCDHQYCCSDCFNDLKVSDTVSCFVPPTEISRKMWIAIMVSKETSAQCEEFESFNEVLRKQNEGGCMNRNMWVNSKSVSIQTESSCLEFGCQTEAHSTEDACQTLLCGDVKLCAITKNAMSQTNVSVKSVSIQTENETKSSECQTHFSFDQCNVESQTNCTGDIKEKLPCSDVLCQTDVVEEKLPINTVNTESQTISTGQVMITKYYHL